MKYFTADAVYPVSSPPVQKGIVALHDDGTVHKIYASESELPVPPSEVKRYRGIICPGFVNTHCHLELSHLKGKLSEKGGFVAFAKGLIPLRHTFTEEEVLQAMVDAEKEMHVNGIVAVGDICNDSISLKVKQNSPLKYHSFIELIALQPNRAEETLARGTTLLNQFSGHAASLTAHAPYSVSNELFAAIDDYNAIHLPIQSIHNQESAAENEFFMRKTGDFVDFYVWLGMNIDFFSANGKSSLASYFPYLTRKNKTLLVHNTFTSSNDIQLANAVNPHLYWCLCPNANLYIEDGLPDVNLLMSEKCRITLGTDSLASNKQLCIANEMAVLQKAFPQLTMQNLLEWACVNGAEFLGLQQTLGTIEEGKKPGLVLLDSISVEKLGDHVKASKIG